MMREVRKNFTRMLSMWLLVSEVWLPLAEKWLLWARKVATVWLPLKLRHFCKWLPVATSSHRVATRVATFFEASQLCGSHSSHTVFCTKARKHYCLSLERRFVTQVP